MGTAAVTKPPTMPRLEAGTNSCTRGRSTQYKPPTPNPMRKRNTDMNIHALSGVNVRMPVATEKLITVMRKTLRRPILSASQP